MEKTATLNLRVNLEVKLQAEQILKQLGVPMSTAVDMLCDWTYQRSGRRVDADLADHRESRQSGIAVERSAHGTPAFHAQNAGEALAAAPAIILAEANVLVHETMPQQAEDSRLISRSHQIGSAPLSTRYCVSRGTPMWNPHQ